MASRPLALLGTLAAAAADSSPWGAVTTFGNHRYVVPVPPAAKSAVAFTAELEWRRSGPDQAISNELVLFCPAGASPACNGSVGQTLLNATVLNSSRLSAFVAIDARALPPQTEAVQAYYMPFTRGPNFYGEQVTYLTKAAAPNTTSASAAWRSEVAAAAAAGGLPHVAPGPSIEYEARTPFDAFTELERTATAAEIAAMLASPGGKAMGDVLLFPEPRERQIRMTWRHPTAAGLPDLPHAWTVAGPSLALDAGAFDKGEFATFQIGLFAAGAPLASVRIDDTVGAAGFAGPGGFSIPKSALNCFNLGGVDNRGEVFNRSYSVPHSQTGALWFGLDIPTTASPGSYSGSIGLRLASADGKEASHTVKVSFELSTATAYRSGDRNLTKMTRTRWIDSRAGETDEPAKRHTALVVDKQQRTVQTWSTLVELDATGLPKQLTRTGVAAQTALLAAPFSFVASAGGCEALAWETTAAIAEWTARCTDTSSGLVQTVQGSLDADGTMMYEIALSAKGRESVELPDARLVMPLRAEAVPYSMGLGRQGGRVVEWDWRWWVGVTEPDPASTAWGAGATGDGFQNNLIW